MQLKRLFTTTHIKNTYRYIDTQKTYELIRTGLYFGISIALYVAGYVATKTNANVLTVAAILGCLPASKSLVSMIMFFRYHSCSKDLFEAIGENSQNIPYQLYDLVFTTEKQTFVFSHCATKGKELYLFSEKEVNEDAFRTHLHLYMERVDIEDINILIFTDREAYLKELSVFNIQAETSDGLSQKVIQLLKEITL